ncbi:MAG: hypothetical protein K6E40_11675 [Desulfovibrio sp.]|nr:hypothetical protein [Desulfovibrio sp.]
MKAPKPPEPKARQARDRKDADASFWEVHFALDAQTRKIQRGARSLTGTPGRR